MAERASGRTRGALWAGLVLAGIAALVVAFSAGYIGSAGAESGSADARWLSIPAPEAEFRTLEGKKASLADYRGQVVILNLWGTWCPPCRREIPHLVDLQEDLQDRDATVVSIAVDSGAEESIRSFASEFGIDYPIWISGTDEVVRHFRAIGFPFTLLIDRDGVIRKQYLGPQTQETLLADADVWIGDGSPTETPKYREASEVGP
ncbi:MAG: TlpA disulfide reductase family protein [Gemmatimonadota bacterium]